MTRTLETLIEQALDMQALDKAAGGNVMVKGWYADLSPEEKEVFEGWIVSTVEQLSRTFEGFREALIQLGKNLAEAFAEGFKNPT